MHCTKPSIDGFVPRLYGYVAVLRTEVVRAEFGLTGPLLQCGPVVVFGAHRGSNVRESRCRSVPDCRTPTRIIHRSL